MSALTRSGQLFVLLISLSVAGADRWSKIAVKQSLTLFDSISLIPGWLRLVHAENPGAAFGILAAGNPWLRSAILIGVSALVLLFVASALLRRSSAFASELARVGLALILGGAFGNLWDRIVWRSVTDFIEVYHGAWSFPAFNVADSAITVGTGLLLIDALRPRSKPAVANGRTPVSDHAS